MTPKLNLHHCQGRLNNYYVQKSDRGNYSKHTLLKDMLKSTTRILLKNE